MHQLSDEWARIISWCQERAPVTAASLNPPAQAEKVARAESATGRQWPSDLRTWFLLHNGSDQGRAFPQVIPGYRPVNLAELEQEWTSLCRIWAPTTAAVGGDDLLAAPAGTTAFTFLESYIPIAANDSSEYVVIDTRSGDEMGCVVEFIGEDTDQGSMCWPSLAAMIKDVADALDSDNPCRGWVPIVVNGYLDWDFP